MDPKHAEASSVAIRPATLADMPAVGRLGALFVREHHEFDPERFIAATSQTEHGYGEYLATQLEEPDVVILVAEEHGAVLGYTYSGIEGRDYMALRGPAGALYDIVVDPSRRGEGIGRKLLEASIAALSGRGVPLVVLSTADRNEPAQRLFARAGFRRTMIEMSRKIDG
jgi:ribosomal protein S18 acetylase RimI-like enzyme